MMRKVVIDDQYVAPLLHKVFSNTGRRIGCDVNEPRWIVAFRYHHDGITHRAFFTKSGDCRGNAGGMLADGTINADDIFTPLIQYRVERNRGFACLPVTQNQLPLTSADRNQRIDGLDPSLQWYCDRRTIQDIGGGAFDRQPLHGGDRCFAIQRVPQWINHPSDQFIAHRYIHDMFSAFYLVTGVQTRIVPKQNHADFIFIEIERNPVGITGEFEHLLEPSPRKTGYLGNPGRNARDSAYLAQ